MVRSRRGALSGRGAYQAEGEHPGVEERTIGSSLRQTAIMKHFSSAVLASCIASTLAAQPTIDLGNFGTLVGETFTVNAGPWIDPGAAGAAQTWDLSGLTSDSVVVNTYVNPSTTPDGASFPTASVALEQFGGFSYLEMSATGGIALGASIPGEAPVVYSDPQVLFAFPCTFTTSWIDDFYAVYTVAGFNVVRTGTAAGTADGHGTLILPWGTLTDVLRISLVWDWIDSTTFITSTFHNEYTYFVQAGTHHPIVEIFTNSATLFASTTITTGSSWLNGISTSVPVAVPVTDLGIHPNPAAAAIALTASNSSRRGMSMPGNC